MFLLLRRLVVLIAAVLAITPEWAAAQQPRPDYVRTLARRVDLEAAARELSRRDDSEAKAELAVIEERLRSGDFRNGDRILLRVAGEEALSDTFVVRTGPVLELPQVPPLPLGGLLRSELQEAVERHLSQYLRNPQVSAIPLIRFGVLGAVARPGYYYVPAEMVVNDIFMVAGGPSPNARIDKSTFRRGTVEVKNKEAARATLASGKSLDELSIQSGDEIRVAAGGASNTLTYVGIITGLATSVAVIASLF